MKYTQATLVALEKILQESGYIIRFERGTFQSGYCILEAKKIVVLNKFLQVEGRINILLDILVQLRINSQALSDDARRTFEQYVQRREPVEKR